MTQPIIETRKVIHYNVVVFLIGLLSLQVGGITKKLQKKIRKFFCQFSLCHVQLSNADQKKIIIHSVYDLGRRLDLPEKMISFQDELNVLYIIGRNEVICPISQHLSGIFYLPKK